MRSPDNPSIRSKQSNRPVSKPSEKLPSQLNGCSRYYVVDCIRGFAVLLMLGFHLTYDVFVFGGKSVQNAFSMPIWFWRHIPDVIGGLFFSVVGISAYLKFSSLGETSYRSFIKRGLHILGLAIGITGITALISPKTAIYFGTLHSIGVSLLLIYPFLRYHNLNIVLGGIFICIGLILGHYRFNHSILLWLGFIPKSGAGADYFPLIPWFGVVLIGIVIGRVLTGKKQLMDLEMTARVNLPFRVLTWIGRKSLLIYLVHQPILFFILRISGVIHFQLS